LILGKTDLLNSQRELNTAEEGGKDARDLAETAASEIKQIFQGAYGDSETSEVVSLETCEAVSNTEMTLADTRRVDQWQS
jgi:hypothetical protein